MDPAASGKRANPDELETQGMSMEQLDGLAKDIVSDTEGVRPAKKGKAASKATAHLFVSCSSSGTLF